MPDVRAQQGTPLTVSQQWTESGVAVDPGTVTVGITRADGTELVAPGTGTGGTLTDPRTFNLTTTHTVLLDMLTITWTSTLKGTLVSYVEVVGGHLFRTDELVALKPTNLTWTTAQIEQTRLDVERAIEDECAVAFVPRYAHETLNGNGTGTLMLRWPYIRQIRSVTVGDTALSVGELADLAFNGSGVLTGYGWTVGTGNVTVGYEHGHANPPPRIRRAGLLLAKSWLIPSALDDRASTFANVDGVTYGMVVPGRGGSVFGLPEVDSACQQYSLKVGIA